MNKFLDSFFASEVLTDAVKKDIREGIEALLAEKVEQTEKDVRAQIAEEYKRDMSRLIEAMDQKLDEGMTRYVKETLAERNQAKALAAKAAKAIAEANTRANKRMNVALEKLSERVSARLEAELKPIYEDRELERAANMRKLKEADVREEERKQKFIENGAAVLEKIVESKLANFITSIKTDLDYARENDFGRKIFEAFSDMFENDFMKRDTLVNKLKSKLDETKKSLKEHKERSASEVKKLSETARKESAAHRKLRETVARTQKINKLTESLTGSARAQMRQLLETAATDKLEDTFKRYRSVVTEGKVIRTDKRSKLSEGTLKTGRNEANFEPRGDEPEDIDVARLRRTLGR